jgi:hypothetical protein
MTIQNTTIRKAGPSQGNGVTTVFPFTFKVFTATDILVTYLDTSGVESALVLTTNYTVSLNADQNTSPGGSVTLLVALATATYITLTSRLANTQTLALTNSGGFYPESINNALDRTVIEIQQLAEQASRSITIPKSSTASPLLPIPTPLNVLAWNVNGTAIKNVSLESLSDLSSYKAAGTGAVTRTVASKLNDTVSVKDFGAVGDGFTDNTAAIQAAYNSGVKSLYIPAGQYNFSGTITIPSSVQTYGAGIGESIFAGTVATQNMFNITATNAVDFLDLTISSTITKTAGVAITYNTAASTQNNYSSINRVQFMFQYTAIDFVRAAYWTVQNCYFQMSPTNAVIVRIRNITTFDSGDASLIDNWFFGGNNAINVLYESGGGLRVIGNKFLSGLNGIAAIFPSGVVTGILTVIGNSFDGQSANSINLTTMDNTASFTNITISANIFDGNPSVAFIYCAPVPGGSSIGRCSITGNVLIQNTGTVPLIIITGGGSYLVSGNTLNGPSAHVGISISSSVIDSVIGFNAMEGVTISNSSTTTLVLDSQTGASPALITNGKISASSTGSFFPIETLISPTLLNGWVNYGAALKTVGYQKDCFGIVHIFGSLKSGTIGSILFTLPSGYRPSADMKFAGTENNSPATIYITSSGNVQQITGSNTELSIGGISFTTQ